MVMSGCGLVMVMNGQGPVMVVSGRGPVEQTDHFPEQANFWVGMVVRHELLHQEGNGH